LSEAETQEFNDWYVSELDGKQYNDWARVLYPKNVAAESKALAWRVIKAGAVDPKAVAILLNSSHSRIHMSIAPELKYVSPAQDVLHASLRVAERMSEYDPVSVSGAGYALASTIQNSMKGYCYTPQLEDRVLLTSVNTEEELDSLSAVTFFLHNALSRGDDSQYNTKGFKDADLIRVDGMRITNRTLDAFLRENPNEVHRVISYVTERGLGHSVRDAKNLIKHLRETADMGALGEGWL
jgi:hypothetical protein